MPALKYQILAVFVFSIFGLVLVNKDKIAIGIMVFFIPFAATPFGLSEAFCFKLGLNAFMIWSIWLGSKIKGVISSCSCGISWRVISPKIVWLYYFLFAGLLLAIVVDRSNVDSQYVSKIEGIVNFSLFIVTTILFIKILVNYRSDKKFQTQLLFIFTATSMVQFASYILNISAWASILPAFLTHSSSQVMYYRFMGLLGDYELIADYSLLVIAFSIILFLQNEYKRWALLFIALAVLIGLLSGTRSYLVIVGIFVSFTLIINAVSKQGIKQNAKIIVLCFLMFITVYMLIGKYVPATAIFERFDTSISFIKERQYQLASGRKWTDIPTIIKYSGLLGNGSLFITSIENSSLAPHCLYLAVYAKYGIIGLFALLYLMLASLKAVFPLIRKGSSRQYQSIAIVYFSLLLSLFVQQVKISGIRSMSSILMYSFLFLNIYFFSYNHNKERTSNEYRS